MNIQQDQQVIWIKDLLSLKKEISKEREQVKKILESSQNSNSPINISTALMIVESPTKAKTIASFFWKPTKRLLKTTLVYEVIIGDKILTIGASLGHIVDLPTQVYLRWIEIKNNIFLPYYQSIKLCKTPSESISFVDNPPYQRCQNILDKKDLVGDFQSLAHEVDEVYLASDPDTEWEKIAFDFYNLLKPFNQNIYRIEYHQVTKNAIIEAINNKREIDYNRVKAQIVRRLADRLVGFALSLKLQYKFKSPNYSAWRVQTPVLWWIIQRDQQTKQKIMEIKLNISSPPIVLKEEDITLYSQLQQIHYVNINKISSTIQDINPYPPFTTDSLISTASEKIGLTPEEIMNLAQSLFEKWVITYHRTDSTHISSTGINIAKEYLKSLNLEDLFVPRSRWPQSTHEWIRPTRPMDKNMLVERASISNTTFFPQELQLYEMIFNRVIASQVKEDSANIDTFNIGLLSKEKERIREYEISLATKILKNTWTKFWPYPVYNIQDGIYKFKGGVSLVPKIFHYSFSEIIKQMKQKWLGRPSTYATIIHTLLKRKYAIRILQKYIKHTSKGEKVYTYLQNLYPDLISEEFTRDLEQKMDQVEKGTNHHEILLKLYKHLVSLNLIPSKWTTK